MRKWLIVFGLFLIYLSYIVNADLEFCGKETGGSVLLNENCAFAVSPLDLNGNVVANENCDCNITMADPSGTRILDDVNMSFYSSYRVISNVWLVEMDSNFSSAGQYAFDVNCFVNFSGLSEDITRTVKGFFTVIDKNISSYLIDINSYTWISVADIWAYSGRSLTDYNQTLMWDYLNWIDANVQDFNSQLFVRITDLNKTIEDLNSFIWDINFYSGLIYQNQKDKVNVYCESATYWYAGNTVKVICRTVDVQGKPIDVVNVKFWVFDQSGNLITGSLTTQNPATGKYYFEYVLPSVSSQMYEVVVQVDSNGWDGNYTKVFRVSALTVFKFEIDAPDVVLEGTPLMLGVDATNEGDIDVETTISCWIDSSGVKYSSIQWNKEVNAGSTFLDEKSLVIPSNFAFGQYTAKCKLEVWTAPALTVEAEDTFNYVQSGEYSALALGLDEGDFGYLAYWLEQIFVLVVFVALLLVVLVLLQFVNN